MLDRDLAGAAAFGNFLGDALNNGIGIWVGLIIDGHNTIAVIVVAYTPVERHDRSSRIIGYECFELLNGDGFGGYARQNYQCVRAIVESAVLDSPRCLIMSFVVHYSPIVVRTSY